MRLRRIRHILIAYAVAWAIFAAYLLSMAWDAGLSST